MKKILLALQFWEGDKKPAMEVARIIADLEPRHCELADFLFVSRFDCEQDMEVVKYVSRKFNTLHYINRWRRGKEWPHGCNELFFGTMDYFCALQESKPVPEYKAILTFEADSGPLHPHWIKSLSDGWDAAKTKMYGPMIDEKGPHPHINGNCMVSGDLSYLRWISRDVGGCKPNVGWDWLLAPKFKNKGWANAPEMRSWWRFPTVSPEVFESLISEGVAFFHGCKDDSLIRNVRRRFLS